MLFNSTPYPYLTPYPLDSSYSTPHTTTGPYVTHAYGWDISFLWCGHTDVVHLYTPLHTYSLPYML